MSLRRSLSAMSEMPDAKFERLIETFEKALEGKPANAIGLIGLAKLAADNNKKLRAFELCRRALAAGAGDTQVELRARRLLASLVPAYHVPMMNDTRRNFAWNRVFSRS